MVGLDNRSLVSFDPVPRKECSVRTGIDQVDVFGDRGDRDESFHADTVGAHLFPQLSAPFDRRIRDMSTIKLCTVSPFSPKQQMSTADETTDNASYAVKGYTVDPTIKHLRTIRTWTPWINHQRPWALGQQPHRMNLYLHLCSTVYARPLVRLGGV